MKSKSDSDRSPIAETVRRRNTRLPVELGPAEARSIEDHYSNGIQRFELIALNQAVKTFYKHSNPRIKIAFERVALNKKL